VPTPDYSIEVGDSFTLRNEYGKHLHVIVAESSPDDQATIFLVYVSSATGSFRDTTTIIKAGEHPFIDLQNKESWIRYQNVIICSREQIRGSIEKHYGKVNPELLKRIQDGVEKSDRVNERDKKLFREWRMDRLYREMKS